MNKWEIAKEETTEDEEGNPENSPGNVVEEKGWVVHVPDACDEGSKSTDNRDKAREDDRLPTVRLIEGARPFQVFTPEEEVGLISEYPRTTVATDRVIHRVSDDRGNGKEKCKNPWIEEPESRERSRRKQEGIAREEGGDNESRFTENGEEEDRVRPYPVHRENPLEMGIEMQQHFNDFAEEFHGRLCTVADSPLHVVRSSVKCHHSRVSSRTFWLLSTILHPFMSASVILRNSLRRLRFDRGMTQEELALRTGVSRQTIMSIERGDTNPSVLLALKIAAAFGVSVTEVFDMEGRLAPV